MFTKTMFFSAIGVLALLPVEARAGITLGTAGNFAVLAGSGVTNTGSTVINGGDVGSSPTTSITGFGPGTITSPYTINNAAAAQAQTDLTTAYNAAAGYAGGTTLTGDLGSRTLTPGVYTYSSSAGLTGTLTLDDLGNSNALFVFQIGSTLTTATDSSVVVTNPGSTPDCNVFWQVGSSATLGTGTAFQGHILALTSITMNTGATITEGSALARNGAVTLASNTITNCASSGAAVPEPATATLVLIGAGLAGMLTLATRSRRQPT